MMNTTFFSIESPCTQHGQIRCDGLLGHEKYPFHVIPALRNGTTISAQADSTFVLHLHRRARICGTLAVTLFNIRKSPCRFLIDDGLLGHVYTGMTPTVFVDLPPGSYKLSVLTESNHDYAYSGWSLLPMEENVDLITEENTLFAICSNYDPGDDGIGRDWALQQSSAKAGIRWSNMFSGGPWEGNYRRKIVDNHHGYRLARESGKKFVLFADARDVVLRHPKTVLLGRLNELYRRDLASGKVLFAADACGYNVPVGRKSWRYLLHQKIGEPQVMANSGTYFGKLDDVLAMLDYAQKAHEAIQNKTPFDDGTRYWVNNIQGDAVARDQGYVQLYHLAYPDRIKLDIDKELFACITEPLRPKNDPPRSHPQLSHVIGDASLIHAPLPSADETAWKSTVETILSGIDLE